MWITLSTETGGSSNQTDLFGGSLIGDLMDAPTSVPVGNPSVNSSASEVDLFADADFVSAPVQVETKASSETKVRLLFQSIMLLLIGFPLSEYSLLVSNT